MRITVLFSPSLPSSVVLSLVSCSRGRFPSLALVRKHSFLACYRSPLTQHRRTACYPLVISAGYIRLRVIVLKDQTNKKSHSSSAHLACEAAGAIRTVASLGREEDCCRQYSASLEDPLRRTYKSGLLSNLTYSLSQSMGFWVIALIFWYGSRLVANLELPMFNFFVSLMVS